METAGRIALTWIELILILLLVLCGMGIWEATQRRVEKQMKAVEPIEAEFQAQEGVYLKQAKLSIAEKQLAAIQGELSKQRLQLAMQAGRLSGLGMEYPSLVKSASSTASRRAVPPDVAKAYRKAQQEKRKVAYLVDSMTIAFGNVAQAASERSHELSKVRRSARLKYDSARSDYIRRKSYQTLYWASPWTVLLLTVAGVFTAVLRRKASVPLNIQLVLLGAAAALVVIFAHQIWHVVGAAVVATFLVLVALGTFSLVSRRPLRQEK